VTCAIEPEVLEARQQAYLEILRWAHPAIRDAAYTGKAKRCEIEADHIHNLPSLFNDPNEKRHHCSSSRNGSTTWAA
jgi:hypothetical protein